MHTTSSVRRWRVVALLVVAALTFLTVLATTTGKAHATPELPEPPLPPAGNPHTPEPPLPPSTDGPVIEEPPLPPVVSEPPVIEEPPLPPFTRGRVTVLESPDRVVKRKRVTYAERVGRKLYAEMNDGSAFRFSPCRFEDSPGCFWDAQHRGDGNGTSVLKLQGVTYRIPARFLR